MDIIQLARDFAEQLGYDERVIAYNTARQQSDEDSALQDLIGQFNLKRIELNSEIGKEEKNNEKITALDGEIKGIYAEVMQNKNMVAYNEAKSGVDKMMNFVNKILAAGINGEDPKTVEEDAGCSGSCDGCAGCQ